METRDSPPLKPKLGYLSQDTEQNVAINPANERSEASILITANEEPHRVEGTKILTFHVKTSDIQTEATAKCTNIKIISDPDSETNHIDQRPESKLNTKKVLVPTKVKINFFEYLASLLCKSSRYREKVEVIKLDVKKIDERLDVFSLITKMKK